MIIRRRSLDSRPRPGPPVHGRGSRPDVLHHQFIDLQHQLVGARSGRRLGLADAAKRLSGQRNPADQYRDRRHPDRNPAWPDHRPRHGDRHVLPLLPHHHQHPSGLRIGADPHERHDLHGRRPDRLCGDHDVPAVVGLLGRAGGRDAGRRMGNRHGADPLRQRRQGDRPRRHGDRRSDHSRDPHHRPRPHRGRTLPQPHQSGDRTPAPSSSASSRTNCAAASSTRRPPPPWSPPRPRVSSTAARAPSSPTPIRWRPETARGLRHAARFRSPTRPPRRRRSEA